MIPAAMALISFVPVSMAAPGDALRCREDANYAVENCLRNHPPARNKAESDRIKQICGVNDLNRIQKACRD